MIRNCSQCGEIKPLIIHEQDVAFCSIDCAEEYGTVPASSPMPDASPMDPTTNLGIVSSKLGDTAAVLQRVDEIDKCTASYDPKTDVIQLPVDEYRFLRDQLRTALADTRREYVLLTTGCGSSELLDHTLYTHAEAEHEAAAWRMRADTIGGTARVVHVFDYLADTRRVEGIKDIKRCAIFFVNETDPANGYERWSAAKEALYNAIATTMAATPREESHE